MSVLLVAPPFAPTPPNAESHWVRGNDDDSAVADQGSAPLALLPTGNDVVLMVPGHAISWHHLVVPPGGMASGRLRPVLEGLLEDRLLDDAADTHFAVQPGAKAGAAIWIAVCNRAALRAAVDAVEATGRRVVRIVPEFAPQPEGAPPLLFATGESQSPQLTVCDASGVLTLPLTSLHLQAVLQSPIDTMVVTGEPAVAAQAEELLGVQLPIVQRAQRWLQAARGPWDLAQFDLASSNRARAGKKLAAWWQELRHAPQWRAARWGVVLLILAQLIGLNAWAWKERRALEAKREAVRNVLTRTFPSVKLVVDAPVQMAREVAMLRQATGGTAASDLEPMLAALGSALPAGRVPTAIDFSGGQLRLRGLRLSQAELTQVSGQLVPRGYQARSEGDLLLVQAEAAR
ncbi:type II secretion system protein GspL [Variovorax dokdonensis]|uniref:Type II secretion system protein GspL n=1 Tax=Variovorax dokdonensis TaxID=344883 RepID=A0ABT7NBN3_9BURK|nr:type II secretion system protein GspL [Variovorax dokdonensis]MDM0045336.1 type II secretion system protein GspL [Variovorax dokdonensis]